MHYGNRNLEISTAPTKVKLQEPAYSQVHIQNKIDKQRVRSRVRQTVRRLSWKVLGFETGGEVGRRGWIRIWLVEDQCFLFGVKELWRDSKRWGFGKFVGWVRYLSQCWREICLTTCRRCQMMVELSERRDTFSEMWRLGALENDRLFCSFDFSADVVSLDYLCGLQEDGRCRDCWSSRNRDIYLLVTSVSLTQYDWCILHITDGLIRGITTVCSCCLCDPD